jgi:hypothetical protein
MKHKILSVTGYLENSLFCPSALYLQLWYNFLGVIPPTVIKYSYFKRKSLELQWTLGKEIHV